MSNGRTEIYLVEQQVKGRRIINMQALVAIILGFIVLGHEIAIIVLTTHTFGRPITTAQIIATVAALFAIFAGLASYFPSKINAALHTLRRSFIISSIISLIATILLAVTLGFYMPRAWEFWQTANSTPGKEVLSHQDFTRTGNQQLDTGFQVGRVGSETAPWMTIYDTQYYQKVLAILRIVALIGDGILVGATLICTILGVINALRRRGNYQPAPIHDPVHGTRVYYDKNSR